MLYDIIIFWVGGWLIVFLSFEGLGSKEPQCESVKVPLPRMESTYDMI